MSLIVTIITLAILTGCNDVAIDPGSKDGPASGFLKAFNDDNPVIPKYALSVRMSHGDRGGVIITPFNADSLYDEGSQVTLEATPTPSSVYVFAGWAGTEGAEDGGSPTTQITMNANRIITANFALHPLILGSGQAWGDVSAGEGMVFREDKTYAYLKYEFGQQSSRWVIDDTRPGGAWSVDEGKLYLDSEYFEYEIQNGELGIRTPGLPSTRFVTVNFN